MKLQNECDCCPLTRAFFICVVYQSLMTFAVLEDPQGDGFVVSRVALFESPMDALEFVLGSSNPEQMQLIELDDAGQNQLVNTPHVVVG